MKWTLVPSDETKVTLETLNLSEDDGPVHLGRNAATKINDPKISRKAVALERCGSLLQIIVLKGFASVQRVADGEWQTLAQGERTTVGSGAKVALLVDGVRSYSYTLTAAAPAPVVGGGGAATATLPTAATATAPSVAAPQPERAGGGGAATGNGSANQPDSKRRRVDAPTPASASASAPIPTSAQPLTRTPLPAARARAPAVKEVRGDLLKWGADVIVQQCNCIGTTGRGLAKVIMHVARFL
jgi:hypothetical protein